MSSLITIEGKVYHDSGVQTFGSKGFKKRTLVIETDAKFNSLIPIDLISDNLEADVSLNDSLTAECYLNGSNVDYFKGRAFLSLTVRKTNVTGKENPTTDAPQSDEVPF